MRLSPITSSRINCLPEQTVIGITVIASNNIPNVVQSTTTQLTIIYAVWSVLSLQNRGMFVLTVWWWTTSCTVSRTTTQRTVQFTASPVTQTTAITHVTLPLETLFADQVTSYPCSNYKHNGWVMVAIFRCCIGKTNWSLRGFSDYLPWPKSSLEGIGRSTSGW